MRFKNITVITLCFFLLGTGLTALAETPVPQNQSAKKIRENISTLMLIRMTSSLDLSEDQTAKIFPKVNSTEKQKQDKQRKLNREMQKLRAAVRVADPDEQSLQEILVAIKNLRAQIRAVDEELSDFLDSNLTVVQRAKYVFFAQEFAKVLREQLARARNVQQKKKKRTPQLF